ncbi:MAG: glycosyltransferase family 2 protein [Promethearchaeota archaeon]
MPVYNEGKSILKIVDGINICLKNKPYFYRITIVDDGSTDDTFEVLKNSSYKLNLISNKVNSGKGISLRKGMAQCTEQEIVITLDGDGEHIPEDIPSIIRPVVEETAKSVVGTRFEDNRFLRFLNPKFSGSYSNNKKRFNFLRRFGNWLFSLFIWIATGVWLNDSQSGFRAFAPGVIPSLNLICNGFQIETEITMQLIKKGYNIEDVAIQTGRVNRPSYMGIVKDSFKILITIFRLKMPYKINKWLCNIFPFILKK